MMTAISNYVAQNYGAGKHGRIGILLLRHPIVRLFLSAPTAEIYH